MSRLYLSGPITGVEDFVERFQEADKLLRGGRSISVRTHTRFTDFPTHKHNYLEMMIVLSGASGFSVLRLA